MRKILRLLVALSMIILVLPPALQAQQRTLTGTVVSEDDKTPLAGVTVRVKGTRRITQTDANGHFSIQVNAGETLEFSHVGYAPQSAKADGNTVGISLKASDNTMGEVVVTAMDIKRNSRELGYSAQRVGGKEIAETQRENFLNSLQGRVAGITITPTSGQAGASSQVVLRGFNSMTGGNQPLFVIDGIILDNTTINETSNGGSGIGLASDLPNRNNDYTNRIGDLNPADIETITVLKGPEATALYGSQASAGAIVITTKKAATGPGAVKIGVSYDNSFRLIDVSSRIAPLNNEFGIGSNGVGTSSFSATSGTFFGPRYPAGTKRFDNIHNFFQTGKAQTHNLSMDIGFKNVGFKVSGSFFDEAGVVPGNNYTKYNLRITNTTKITKWLDISPSFQYINSTNDKPLRSAGGYLLGLYIWPNNVDIRNYTDADGNKVSVFSSDPYSEIDNPLYNVHQNVSHDKNKRMIFSGGININPFSWLSISGRFGYDTYSADGYTFYSPLSYLTSRAQNGGFGRLTNYWRDYKGYNHTITATAKKDIGKFSGRLMVGQMWQDYRTEVFSITGTNLVDSIGTLPSNFNKLYKNGQIVTDANFEQTVGAKTDSNITRPNTRVRLARNKFGLPNVLNIRQNAYFGEVGISYNNLAFLSYTHRFEEASVFPKQNRKFDYPGMSASVILSDIFPALKKGNVISYWKLRGSRAETARYPDAYKNQSVFVDNFTSSAVGSIYSYGFDNNNPDLRPERQKTYEIGTELRLFNSRLSFDLAYYNTLCTDQIVNQFRASYATGYVLNTQNAASIKNQGVELVTDVVPVQRANFAWNIRFNFAHMWSKVLTLPDAIAYEMYIADTWLYQNARGGMVRGMPATTITGFHYLRNTRGQIIISPTTGLPIQEQTFTVIGDRMPDFTLGTLNNIRYKNWNLSFLWDLKVGGDVWDATDQYLTWQGKSQRTADREKPRVIQGVLQDGKENTATPTANTIVVVPYYQQAYYTGMPEEEFIEHNVNYLRLRDLTLSYTFPARSLSRLGWLKSLALFVTGNDLIVWSNYRGADPTANGNTAGSNGVGGMGMDYGSLPTPRAVNFGLRANFR
ncbi:MAG TPA: SusC/RagA family TonB-linked outer membrane protein [Chitinophagaceae bacterium]|nr:SusC/RagA family TonB-linked outer membrane protein [Chitinophagaceae bacterium]